MARCIAFTRHRLFRQLLLPHTIRAVRTRRRAGSRKPCWTVAYARRAVSCSRMDHVAKSDRRILLLLGLTTVARLIFAAPFPPLDDEAYYRTTDAQRAWRGPYHSPI